MSTIINLCYYFNTFTHNPILMKLKKALIVGTLILSVFGLSTVVSAVNGMMFPDVEQDSWYEDAAIWAADAGLVEGIDGNFVPSGEVTRAQLVVIMHRFDQYLMDKYGLVAMDDLDDADDADDTSDDTEVTYQDISPAAAKAMIDTNEDLIVIDVSPNYADGHLPGAVNYYVGDGSLDDAIPSLDAEAVYLVYCHNEDASRLGAQKMVDAGFTTVYRLEGDYGAWVDAGYEVEM